MISVRMSAKWMRLSAISALSSRRTAPVDEPKAKYRRHGMPFRRQTGGRIIGAHSERQLDATRHEGVGDGAGIWHRAGEPVQFRHDEGIAGADCGQSLVEPGAGP